jgi:release factor glutamine methyltransferase
VSQTVGARIAAGRRYLETATPPLGGDLALDARWLMAHALGLPRDRVILHLSDPMDDVQAARFEDLVARRHAGQPLSQITGARAFFGREFLVDGSVLDPRPETETLIELCLAQPFERVLDLGTGSGCILATLLAERPTVTGVGVDVSPEALAVARRNLSRLGVAGQGALIESDWFAGVDGQFDLIVSNPPYITEDDYAQLAPTVRDWEPKVALTPGGDGLAAYRVLARTAPEYLSDGGRLIVEIGHDQGAAVASLFHAAGLEDVKLHADLNGRDRVVSGRRVPG